MAATGHDLLRRATGVRRTNATAPIVGAIRRRSGAVDAQFGGQTAVSTADENGASGRPSAPVLGHWRMTNFVPLPGAPLTDLEAESRLKPDRNRTVRQPRRCTRRRPPRPRDPRKLRARKEPRNARQWPRRDRPSRGRAVPGSAVSQQTACTIPSPSLPRATHPTYRPSAARARRDSAVLRPRMGARHAARRMSAESSA
jgi:hypothetical protein